ncbi:MAG: RNA chaperone Hfq [Oscillospiraceae bacterium]|nr:RNA chaperone Hfq [Oscillospiraceae bacterium]
MQKRDSSIQDAILDKLQEERKPVTVVIINGFQIKGRISASDRHVVVMDTDGKQQIVYKHAISTIMPWEPVSL